MYTRLGVLVSTDVRTLVIGVEVATLDGGSKISKWQKSSFNRKWNSLNMVFTNFADLVLVQCRKRKHI